MAAVGRTMRCDSNSAQSESEYPEPIGDVAALLVIFGVCALWLLIYCIIPFARIWRSSGEAA